LHAGIRLVTWVNMATLREDIADLHSRLDLHGDLIDDVERELEPGQTSAPAAEPG
jgi:hypothetical protein